jgi:hypothetical protein
VRYGDVYAVAPFDGDGLVVVELAAKHLSTLARILGPTPKSILIVSDGWQALVGPVGDNVARGAVTPAQLADSPEQIVRILAFGYFVGKVDELPTRMGVAMRDVRVLPIPGEARDHLESALKQPTLPKACISPAKMSVRTRRG